MEKNEISILSDATPDKGGEFVRQAQDDIENFRLNRALEKIWQEIDRLNKEIDTEKPWQISDKKRLAPLLSGWAESILEIGSALSPFMPETSEKIKAIFEAEKIVKAEPLFPRK